MSISCRFFYPLSKALSRTQRKLGVEPYKVRDSKLSRIIELLEGAQDELVVPIADTYTDEKGNIELQMFRV